MRRFPLCRIGLPLLAAVLCAGPALAAPPPPAVEAMLREAAKGSDLDAVVKVAKATNPGSVAEIDALVAGLKADADAAREARLASAGLFDAWSGTGQLGFSKSTGNTDNTGIVVGAELKKDGLTLRHTINGQVDRQTTGGVLTRNKYLAGYQLDYKITPRLFAYGNGSWDKDSFTGISRRFSESVGLGYSVFKSDTITLDVTGGPAFRQTRYVTGLSDNTTTVRAGADFSWKVWDNLTLIERAQIFLNSEIKSTTAIQATINDALAARLSFDITRQDRVPAGRRRTDTATLASIVYSFGQ